MGVYEQTWYGDFAEEGGAMGRALLAFAAEAGWVGGLVTAVEVADWPQNGRFVGSFRGWFWEDPDGRPAIHALLRALPPTVAWVECRMFDAWARQVVYRLVNVWPQRRTPAEDGAGSGPAPYR